MMMMMMMKKKYIGKRERDLPDDEELIKEMPPLMIDYSALMGRVFFFFFPSEGEKILKKK
jgi:hypothetical protein